MLFSRRAWIFGLTACAGIALVGFAWNTRAAQNDPPGAKAGAAAEQPLPIKQVVLFNSGVGYLQREGDVAGDAKVDLSFPTSDINDLLKSLVLQDLGGGKVSTVSYDSHDPLDKILRSFAIDLNNNPSFGQILNQARGEKIEVQLMGKEKALPARITGLIVGMEVKQVREKDVVQSVDILNLMGPDGLQSIPLEQVLGVKFLNPILENEFQRALKVLAASHDTQKKTVTLGFTGQGKRAVRVGYVVERPIWKTSYRLRMEPNGKVFLQGWAMVENTSDDDWNDVRMVLVSGKPITFKMNLYEPLYIPRPTVEPDQFASLRPPVYSGAMNADQKEVAQAPGMPPAAQPGQGLQQQQLGLGGFAGGGLNNNIQNWGNTANPMGQANPYQNGLNFRNQNNEQNKLTYEELQVRQKALKDAKAEAKDKGAMVAMNFKEGIQSVASAEEVGDYFQYLIDQRISLSRQKSAMLPILDHTIEGQKISIYNESVQSKFPLLGLRLKNTSGQPLTQGPITVYDNATYAGDTRILDLQPNEERLLSYALDQGTEVKTEVKMSPSPEMTFAIGEPTMTARFKERETKTYTIKNRSTHDRVVIVEHPIRSGWTLVDPAKPAEKTRNMYRFEVKVDAGKTATLAVAEDQPRVDAVAVRTGNPVYVSNTGIQVKEYVKLHEETLQAVRVVKGILTPTMKAKETRSLFVQNISDVDRTFNIDQIVRPEWTLLLPKESIKGPAVHRVVLKVEKGKAADQETTEERVFDDKGKLVKDLSEAKIREYMNSPVVGNAVKTGLGKLLELSRKLADANKEVADLDRQMKALSDDQARLRENLRIIPQSAEPYKKFLDKFVSQETEIEGLQRQVRNAQAALNAAQRDFDAFTTTWTAE